MSECVATSSVATACVTSTAAGPDCVNSTQSGSDEVVGGRDGFVDIVLYAADGVTPLVGPVDFGLTNDESFVDVTFVVKNEGNIPTTVTPEISGEGFAFTGTLPSRLIPGESAAFAVRLSSFSLGVKTGELSMSWTDVSLSTSQVPITVALVGEVEMAYDQEPFNITLNGSVTGIIRLSNGDFIISGAFTSVNGQSRRFIARCTKNGALTAFDAGAIPVGTISGITQVDDDTDTGWFYAYGSFTSIGGTTRQKIAPMNNDFTHRAWTNPSPAPGNVIYRSYAQPDGKFIGCAQSNLSAGATNYIQRFNVDGSRDATFTTLINAGFPIAGVIPRADGKLLVAGSFSTVSGVARNYAALLDGTTGTVDVGFVPPAGTIFGGADGIAVYKTGPHLDKVVMVASGSILGTGEKTTRFNSNGSLDSSFTGVAWEVALVAMNWADVAEEGPLIVVGSFSTIDGVSNIGMAGFDRDDGTFDWPLGAGNYNAGTAGGDGGRVVLICEGDFFMVGGQFTNVNGETRTYLAKLRTSLGSLYPIS